MAPTLPLTKAQLETHNKLLLDLQATREKLLDVDSAALDKDRRREWTEQIYEISLAVSAAQQAFDRSVSATYAQRLSSMQLAIAKLNHDATPLDKANEVITVVGAELGTITSIVKHLT